MNLNFINLKSEANTLNLHFITNPYEAFKISIYCFFTSFFIQL